MSLIHVRLARDSFQTPWGFRLQGGKDLKQPLTVQRVFANTPSEGELQRGDVILSINGRDTSAQTHKQAQDIISKGGGQIEFLVQRPPPGQVQIKPLTPTVDTRAPTFPHTPTKSPQINIPIRRKSGPSLPRTIPVSPQKSAPPQPSPKPTRARDDMSVGFTPKKVTLSKYGGGTHSYGVSAAAPSPQSYRSVAPPQSQSQYRPAPAPAPAPEPVYRAPPEEPHYDSQPQYHSLPAQHSQPDQQDERGVEEETYGGVSERRRTFMSTGQTQQTVKRTQKPVPTFGQARGGDVVDYGVSYSKPQSYQKPASPSKSAPRPRPPAVNASSRDDVPDSASAWSSTLRNEGSPMKIWEKEQALLDHYQGAPANEPFRPSEAPRTQAAPKQKVVQITTQSTVRPPPAAAGHSESEQTVPFGRDWSNSYVYKMIKEDKTSTRQEYPGSGQAPQEQSTTTTRTTTETKYPGQSPQRTVKETVSHGGPPSLSYNADLGMSDF